jgi:hypothetical protein
LLFIVVGIVVLIVVALVVYLVLAGRQAKSVSAARRKARGIVIRPALQVVGQVLSLVRDEAGGPLQVEIGGVRYRRLADVQDPLEKRQIVEAAMELIQFTGVLGQATLAPAPLEKTESWREDLRHGSQVELAMAQTADSDETPKAAAPPEVEEQFLSKLVEEGQAPAQPERPGLVSAVRHRLAPKLPEPGRPRTFVDDIEDIVQRRIQMMPALAGRGLHVHSDATGKVAFLFDGQEFGSVDEIPNLTARALVQDAIQEWDQTT